MFRVYYLKVLFLVLQDELKIDDDCFEDLQSLYKLFDLDKDGILNFKEYEKLLRCLGYRLSGIKKSFLLSLPSDLMRTIGKCRHMAQYSGVLG